MADQDEADEARDDQDADSDALAESCPRSVAELLAAELHDLDARISCLTRSRGTIHEFLIRTEHAAVLSEAAMSGTDA